MWLWRFHAYEVKDSLTLRYHQISFLNWYCNFDSNHVDFWMPLLVSIVDTIHSLIYCPNINCNQHTRWVMWFFDLHASQPLHVLRVLHIGVHAWVYSLPLVQVLSSILICMYISLQITRPNVGITILLSFQLII